MTARRRALGWVAALVALGTLAACGGGGTSPSAAPQSTVATTAPATSTPTTTPTTTRPAELDPCALVSQAEAEVLAATPLEAGVPAGIPGERTCTYTGPVTGPTAQVEVFTGPGAKKFLDIDRELGHEITTVAGIGDEAHEEEWTIFLRKGSTWAAIRLVRLDDYELYRAPLQDLARSLAAQL